MLLLLHLIKALTTFHLWVHFHFKAFQFFFSLWQKIFFSILQLSYILNSTSTECSFLSNLIFHQQNIQQKSLYYLFYIIQIWLFYYYTTKSFYKFKRSFILYYILFNNLPYFLNNTNLKNITILIFFYLKNLLYFILFWISFDRFLFLLFPGLNWLWAKYTAKH